MFFYLFYKFIIFNFNFKQNCHLKTSGLLSCPIDFFWYFIMLESCLNFTRHVQFIKSKLDSVLSMFVVSLYGSIMSYGRPWLFRQKMVFQNRPSPFSRSVLLNSRTSIFFIFPLDVKTSLWTFLLTYWYDKNGTSEGLWR